MKVVGDEEDQNISYEILKELILTFLNVPQPWCVMFLRAKKLRCAYQIKVCVLETSFRKELQCHGPGVKP